MDMNILKYYAFVKTVEYGSFTKASEILNYSQSGISRMIKDLESKWNIILVERNHTGINLTSDGLKMLPYAKKICEEYQNLQLKIDELNNLDSGLIRIGTFSSVATHWIPNIIKEFQIKYPNVEYEILLGDYQEIENWINEGIVDFGFLALPTKTHLETTFLEQDKYLVTLPIDHPLTKFDKISPTQICNYPFILLEKGYKSDILNIFDKTGLKPNIKFKTWDDYAVMSMVEKNLGLSILPSLILKRIPYKIVTKELTFPAFRNIGLAFRNKKVNSIAVNEFLKYIESRDQ
ncbi:MAG: LysR family transcriptional regulator [Pleomorphochaeta sp.]